MKSHSIIGVSCLRRPLLVSALLIASFQPAFAENNQIADVQSALKEKHFYFGDVDGNLDDATRFALRRFQFRNGLPGTGEMDAATLQTLAGNPSPRPKAEVADVVSAQSLRDNELARQIESDERRIVMKTTSNTEQKRNVRVNALYKEQRAVPGAGYTEQVPSWRDAHRPLAENAIEIRRALPITSEARNEYGRSAQAPSIPHEDETETPAPQTNATRITAHFTAPDGHVFTYYKVKKTPVTDSSVSQTSPFGGVETNFPLHTQLPDWERNSSGGWRVVDR
jgi:peptidoglycan hydrolase-like protein with peptidoglycan-binding domain